MTDTIKPTHRWAANWNVVWPNRYRCVKCDPHIDTGMLGSCPRCSPYEWEKIHTYSGAPLTKQDLIREVFAMLERLGAASKTRTERAQKMRDAFGEMTARIINDTQAAMWASFKQLLIEHGEDLRFLQEGQPGE